MSPRTSGGATSRPWGRWVGGLVLLALLVVGVHTYRQQATGPWFELQRRDMVLGVDFEGELEAVQSVFLGPPPVPGVWTFKVSFLAPEGKEVAAGQPVLRFDASDLQRKLQQRLAERDSADKQLEKAVQDLQVRERNLELSLAEAEARWRQTQFSVDVPADIVSRREIEEAKIDQRLAQLEIDHLRAGLAAMDNIRETKLANLRQRRDRAADKVTTLQDGIAAMTVEAPRAGTVILTNNWRNEKIKVGDQVWRAYRVIEIPDLSAMRVDAEVAEADAGRLRVGQPATLYLDAYPDREYRGRLTSIRRAVQAKTHRPAEKVVKVQVELETTDTERMRPGMRLQGRLEVERIRDVVTVPEDAVFTGPAGIWVWTRTPWGKERRVPQLGRRDGRYFQVLDGLDAGDRVLSRPQRDGGESDL